MRSCVSLKAIVLVEADPSQHPSKPRLCIRLQLLAVPLPLGVLYPLIGALFSPMIASAAMSLSSVSVISNALRIRNDFRWLLNLYTVGRHP